AEGAASLSGRVVAKEGGNLPNRLRVHLIPAEAAAADEVLRYREIQTEKNGSFEFKHLAPGKYRLLARSISDPDKDNKDKPRPAAFDSTERIKLRKEAEAANNEIELKPCQRVKDHVLRW
ncbi:MAG: carboxypeptidase-like regulatory domain-containing protein, partial [Blastocatellia bacterium]